MIAEATFGSRKHPGERELRGRDAEILRHVPELLHLLEQSVRAQAVVEEVVHALRRRAAVLRRRLARLVLAGEDALRERRPDDLRDAVLGAEWNDVALRAAPEHRVLRLAGDELLDVRKCERLGDLVHRPLAEADVAGLALPHDLGERFHRLLERRVPVVAMALVQVDVVGAQACERRVHLLDDLRAREPAAAVRHREEDLRREHVRVALPPGEHLAEELFGSAAGVDVRGVDEVDADLERLRDAGLGLVAPDAAAVGQP